MKLTFLGAAQTVTGSSILLQAGATNVLIDCGMFQGEDKALLCDLPIAEKDIDYILITHAHIDHTGRLPVLVSQGFDGRVICVDATLELCNILLRDSTHIQLMELERENRKRSRAGKPPLLPEYTMEDTEQALTLFLSYPYQKTVKLNENISVKFLDAGHLLGSSSIEVTVSEGSQKRTLIFSGDIGNENQPIIQDPTYFKRADYVIMESTYGDRDHGEQPDVKDALKQVIVSTFSKGGNVVIPAFAVGRTQEVLYYLRELYAQDALGLAFANCPVYLDSPLAIEATKIYVRNNIGYYDEEALALVAQRIAPMQFPQLHMSVTADDSRAINDNRGPCIILSASGMCDAGRIRHHLKHNLWKPHSTIVFLGYQARGTLGRILLDGAKVVKLFGEPITVEANIVKISGMSAHADQSGLRKWIHAFHPNPRKVFVVHGEARVSQSFAKLLTQEGISCEVPTIGQQFDLLAEKAVGKPIKSPAVTAAKAIDTLKLVACLQDVGEKLLAKLNAAQRALLKGEDGQSTQALVNQLKDVLQKNSD